MGGKVALEESKGSFHPPTLRGVRFQRPIDKDDGLAPILQHLLCAGTDLQVVHRLEVVELQGAVLQLTHGSG